MKLKTILVTLLLSQILFAASDEENTTTDKPKIEKIEIEKVKIEKNRKTFSPKFLSMAKTSFKLFEPYKSTIQEAPFIEERFYPLGYSSDGKIAYIIEYHTGDSGIVHIETYVQDLISDEIIWQDKFQTQENATDINFKSFWDENQKKIETELNIHNIDPFNKLWLKTEPISYENETFSLSSKVNKSHAKDLNLSLVDSSTVSIHSKSRGEKSINKKEYDPSSSLLDRKAIGFIPLGKENKRTAVVIATIYRGWEGPPHVISYEIIGANLAMGFAGL